MRIVPVPQTWDAAGHYRLFFPLRELRVRGHEVPVLPYNVRRTSATQAVIELVEPERFVRELDPDVLVLHQQQGDFWADLLDDWQPKRLVVDIDDHMRQIPSWHPAESKLWARLDELVDRADLVTAPTECLADEYGGMVLPNFLDWEMWEDVPLQFEVERRRLRVGWMGRSGLRSGDLKVLQGIIGPWLERHPEVEFVAAGDPLVHEILGVPVAQRVSTNLVVFAGEPRGLADITAVMDIGLVPLAEHPFNEAKSCLKGMEYAACGIPCIASPTGPYRGWVDDGENGLLARKPADWFRALDLLVGDDQLRRQMGANARAKAERHTIQEHWGLWEETYAGLRADADAARTPVAA